MSGVRLLLGHSVGVFVYVEAGDLAPAVNKTRDHSVWLSTYTGCCSALGVVCKQECDCVPPEIDIALSWTVQFRLTDNHVRFCPGTWYKPRRPLHF